MAAGDTIHIAMLLKAKKKYVLEDGRKGKVEFPEDLMFHFCNP